MSRSEVLLRIPHGRIFLEFTDVRFEADKAEVVGIVEAVAAGTATEGVLAKWMRKRITEG